MKTLLLMRHAKSSWKSPGLADHDRPLNSRGERDAPRMGKRLRDAGLIPDEVFCSTAARARQTWDLASSTLEEDIPVVLTNRLYLAPPGEILDVISTADRYASSLLVIGHNPGMEHLLYRLTGLEEAVPTAAIAWMEFPIDHWAEVREVSGGRLVDFWYPKDNAGQDG